MTIYSNRTYLKDKFFSKLDIDCSKIVSVSVGYLIIPDAYIQSSNEEDNNFEKESKITSNENEHISNSPRLEINNSNKNINNKKPPVNKGKNRKKITKKNKHNSSPEHEEIETFKVKLENSTVHKSFVYKIIPNVSISIDSTLTKSILIK
jgi:hypothetical protein